MNPAYTVLLLEDEPLILMDLEMAVEDRGCRALTSSTIDQALQFIAEPDKIDVAILDVSLGGGYTCMPVARELKSRGIPFILHSGDLDRHEERVRTLDAPLIAKPAMAEKVVAAAIAFGAGGEDDFAIAAE